MELNLKYSLVNEKEFTSKDFQKKLNDIHQRMHAKKDAGLTWLDWPINYDKKEFAKVLKLAREIEKTSDVLLVVGIGGSYLGARAGIDMLAKNSKLEVVFAGTSFDYSDLIQKLDNLKNKDVTVNVISKSGTTVEILSTLNIVERFMKNKYKTNYKSRIIYTTDKTNGYLRKNATLNGIETLTVPDSMGGRFSVLSSVGLLPLACAGVNIKKIMEGATAAYECLKTPVLKDNIAYQYAIYRYLINKKMGKQVELFSSFHTQMASFGKWLQQLFAESDGKEGKGLFITQLTFSTDLHSVGQYIQQGSPIVAETFLKVKNQAKDTTLSNIALDSPIKFLDGKSFNDINNAAFEGTVAAHHDANVPIAIVSIDNLDEYNFGYLVYFFELACAAGGYLLGINPFNQPGVEQYKSYMKNLLKN